MARGRANKVRIYPRRRRWWADYWWSGRRWRYAVADSEPEAQEAAARIRLELIQGTHTGPW